MKSILISITSYHKSKEPQLRQVLETYRNEYTDCKLTFVLSCNYPFEYPDAIQLPAKYTGFGHVWNNKAFIQEHYQEYDYVIESDDDIQIPRAAFDYYCKNTDLIDSCPDSEKYIVGLLLYEEDKQGKKHLINLHSTNSKECVAGKSFLVPGLRSTACFIADRKRYGLALARGMMTTPGSTSLPVPLPDMARSDIYHKFKKLVGEEDIATGAALCRHLGFKYADLPDWLTTTPKIRA